MKRIVILLLSFFVLNAYSGLKTYKSENHTFLFSHGFGGVGDKAKRYAADGILPTNTVGFDYQDADLKVIFGCLKYGVGLKLWQSCLGQQADVERLLKAIEKQEKPVVLFGESRGASTIINLARAIPDNVKAIVVDSPFDCIVNVVDYRMGLWGANKVVDPKKITGLLPKILPNYKLDGPQPITSLEQFNEHLHHIPILFICSKEDVKVPYSSSHALYKALKQRNHPMVHLLTFDKGEHGWMLEGPGGESYRNVVHAFFANYGLDYIEEYAEKGKELFATTQPALE